MPTTDAVTPSRALILPLADIIVTRDERSKLKVAGTVTMIDPGSATCVVSDLSSTAVFNSAGFEASARSTGVAPPSLAIDLSSCLEDPSVYTPGLGDKVQCTGYLERKEIPGASNEKCDDCVLQAIQFRISDQLDIAAWNQAARKVSHYKHKKPSSDEHIETVLSAR
ncbi:hypothetical protein K437DRAFT_253198 [Tilletiaria anomala UBC 951]|uniref:Uncharacterized protein n=1 Tax=Tilletiaria anomala (strain ATCC 24038 / CBS 436.72 / UBC 951) TaxID=1037660 RepID=A0A066WRA9_TILAU|nr:uncharacterized protein K437DRAFT_253198 [Tilletiaria anomala UBC 951]KDN53185.1 hypothetical protein K437DRAFT_253198 [Tilletiaria anomala UBC 951]